MKKVLLILTLTLAGSVLAATTKSSLPNLTIVDEVEFYVGDFWETPAGLAFWETVEGKTVLKMMDDYKAKTEAEAKQQP